MVKNFNRSTFDFLLKSSQGFDYKNFVFKYIRQQYDCALRALFYNSRPDIVNKTTFVSIK